MFNVDAKREVVEMKENRTHMMVVAERCSKTANG